MSCSESELAHLRLECLKLVMPSRVDLPNRADVEYYIEQAQKAYDWCVSGDTGKVSRETSSSADEPQAP